MLIVAVIGGLVLALQVRHTLEAGARASAEYEALAETNHQRAIHLQAVWDEHAQLLRAHEALTLDRDNLLAQIGRAMEERDKAVADQNVMQKVLKRTAQASRDVKAQVLPLTQANEELRAVYDGLLRERDELRGQLDAAKDRSRAKHLQQALKEAKQEQKESRKALRGAERHVKKLESQLAKTRAKLTKVESRKDDLQKQYTSVLSDKVKLKRQVEKTPKKVTRLAQQHQRLIKETADMHYNLGVLLSRRKNHQRAALEFQKVIELEPDDADSHYNLGVIYAEHLPNTQKAMAYFRRYLQINPQAGDASWVKQYIASWQAWEVQERLD